MGQMLIAGKASGEVAEKGRPKNVTAGNIIPAKCDDLELSRKESAEAQLLAKLPAEDFEKIKFVASKNRATRGKLRGCNAPFYFAKKKVRFSG